MSLLIANIPAILPSCKLGSKSNVLPWLALPYGTHEPYCVHEFCKAKGEDPPQILLQVQALPRVAHNPPGKVCAGGRVSPPALWGVPVLRHDARFLQSQQLLTAQRGSRLLLPISLQSKGGLRASHSPCGFRRAGGEESSPQDAQKPSALTRLTELERKLLCLVYAAQFRN